MEDEIKNCPFCGKRPSTRITFGKPVISCNNKKCLVAPCTWLRVQSTDAKDAIKAWNKRVKE